MEYPDPFEEVIDNLTEYWDADGETFERICKVVFTINESTSHLEIAEEADCAPNSVKKHLDRLAELGIVEKHPRTKMARYHRSSAYIEWRVLQYIMREYSMEQITERVELLEIRREEIINRMEELEDQQSRTIKITEEIENEEENSVDENNTVPSIIQTDDIKLYESASSKMDAANELARINRRIRLYELARLGLNNGGRIIPYKI